MFKKVCTSLMVGALASSALVGPVSAHVSVNPKSVEQGSYAKLTFRVPNERPNTSTTKVEVHIPTDKPIASVGVQPHHGWDYTVEKSKPSVSVQSHGREVTEVVSKVTWTAKEGFSIQPGQFEEFNISAGPLPKDVESIAFKSLQTYSDGEVVRWIEIPAVGEESEHPAPKLTLTTVATTSPAGSSPKDKGSNDSGWVKGLAATALVVSVVALCAALRPRKKQN